MIDRMKWVIMQELEGSNCANPYLIVSSEERAEELCDLLAKKHPMFVFWAFMCEEEDPAYPYTEVG